MKKFFELNKSYCFELNDLIAVLYVICAVLGIMNINATVLFLSGSILGFVGSFKAHRINLLVLNGAFIVLNGYYLISSLVR